MILPPDVAQYALDLAVLCHPRATPTPAAAAARADAGRWIIGQLHTISVDQWARDVAGGDPDPGPQVSISYGTDDTGAVVVTLGTDRPELARADADASPIIGLLVWLAQAGLTWDVATIAEGLVKRPPAETHDGLIVTLARLVRDAHGLLFDPSTDGLVGDWTTKAEAWRVRADRALARASEAGK